MVCCAHTDSLQYRDKPSQHAKMTRRGWCPPLFAQHDGPSTASPSDSPPPTPPPPAATNVGGDDSSGVLTEGGGVSVDGVSTLSDVEAIQRVLSSLGDSMPMLSEGQLLG